MIRVFAISAALALPAFVIWRRRNALKKPGPRIEPSQQPVTPYQRIGRPL